MRAKELSASSAASNGMGQLINNRKSATRAKGLSDGRITSGCIRRLINTLLVAMLLTLPAMPMQAKTIALTVPGYEYQGKGEKMVLDIGNLNDRKVTVSNAFTLYFNPNGYMGEYYVEKADKGYGTFGRNLKMEFKPYTYMKITGIRIYVYDDESEGIWTGSKRLTFVSGSPGYYVWDGLVTESTLSLVVKSEAKRAMKFKCIEVDYDNVITGIDPPVEPDDPNNPGGGGEDPEKPEEEVTPVIIFSPDGTKPVAPGTKIELSCNSKTAKIYYRTDGKTPEQKEDELYTEPIELSLPDRMTVTALAVNPSGKYSTGEVRYRFSDVGTIESFLENGSEETSTVLKGALTVAFCGEGMMYVKDSRENYIPVSIGSAFSCAAGTVFSSLEGVIATDKEGFKYIRATSVPVLSSTGGKAPLPQEADVAKITNMPLHSFVTIRDVKIVNSVAFTDNGKAVWLNDRFSKLKPEAENRKSDIAGFVGLYGGAKCLYPTGINIKNLPSGGSQDTGESADTCQLAITATGGKVEVFTEINDYTRTPIGKPLEQPCKVLKNATAYAFLLPEGKKEMAGAFLDGVSIENGNPILSQTAYGVMVEIKMDADHQLLVVFAELDGIESIGAGSATAEYYTLQGVRLGTERPQHPGVYIVRSGRKVSKLIIK